MSTPIQHYIKKLKDSGYSDQVILDEFKNKGYEEHIIKEELKNYHHTLKEKEPPTTAERYIAMVGAGCVVLFMIWVMSRTQSSPFWILVGFLPSLCVVVLTLVLIEQMPRKHKAYLWVLPLLTSAIYYTLGMSTLELDDRMDLGGVTMLNFIVGMLYIFLINFLMHRPFELPAAKPTIRRAEPQKKQKIEESIQALEDKLKAINFAIGRVYRRTNGGTLEIRNKIKIPAEVYNFFSQITAEHAQAHPAQVKQILLDLQQKLKALEKTEKELFGEGISTLKNLKRHWDGSNRVLDVLAWNDDDPVNSYYTSAEQFCKEAIEELDKIAKK